MVGGGEEFFFCGPGTRGGCWRGWKAVERKLREGAGRPGGGKEWGTPCRERDGGGLFICDVWETAVERKGTCLLVQVGNA